MGAKAFDTHTKKTKQRVFLAKDGQKTDNKR